MKKTNLKLPAAASVRASYLIADIGRLHRLSLDKKAQRLGLTRSEWWLIAFLVFFNGSNQQQLADVMEIGRSGVAKLIDRLEKKQLLSRTSNTADGRLKHVHLSAQAKPLADSIRRILLETGKQSMRRLTPAQVEEFNRMLGIIEETMLDDLKLAPVGKIGTGG